MPEIKYVTKLQMIYTKYIAHFKGYLISILSSFFFFFVQIQFMALLLVSCSRKVVKDQCWCLLFYRNIFVVSFFKIFITVANNQDIIHRQLNLVSLKQPQNHCNWLLKTRTLLFFVMKKMDAIYMRNISKAFIKIQNTPILL